TNDALRPAAAVLSPLNRIADGARSNPQASNPALAQARTSCPVPQPGTATAPRGRSGWDVRKSSKPGDGSPFSHGMSPVWYRDSQSVSFMLHQPTTVVCGWEPQLSPRLFGELPDGHNGNLARHV